MNAYLFAVIYRVSKDSKHHYLRLYDTQNLCAVADVTKQYIRPGARWTPNTRTLRVAVTQHLPDLFGTPIVLLD